jgi:dTDP-4-dehydrorhamnose reductase
MAHHILLIGGHGKVAQLLTPLLLAKSWNVTSMIRTASQKSAIEKLGQGQPGKLNVLVSSVADVKNEGDAKSILEQVKPDWVVWSAGKHSTRQECMYTHNNQEPVARAARR